MADFEDSTSPTWANLLKARPTCAMRWPARIDVHSRPTGKQYALNPDAGWC
jgi:malate synthase